MANVSATHLPYCGHYRANIRWHEGVSRATMLPLRDFLPICTRRWWANYLPFVGLKHAHYTPFCCRYAGFLTVDQSVASIKTLPQPVLHHFASVRAYDTTTMGPSSAELACLNEHLSIQQNLAILALLFMDEDEQKKKENSKKKRRKPRIFWMAKWQAF